MRSIVRGVVLDAIERESYRIGDNGLDEVTERMHERVVLEVFAGREYSDEVEQKK